MKQLKYITALFSLVTLVSITAFSADLSLNSTSACLMEASTGKILYEMNADEKLEPASVTKIMSLILVFEAMDEGKFNLDTEVSGSEHACSMGGSQIWLEPGETMTVNEMLKAVVVASANDCTVALGELVAGSEESFVALMNDRAAELGMNNTHFVNCCGLDVEGHVSTAYDIALMSAELMSRFPDITTYTTTRIDSMTHVTNKGSSEFGLTNTNKLLTSYEGITGLKTGSTSKARYCLSATATRNDIDMIAVVLSAPDTKTRFKEAATLLNYGFSQCKIYMDDHTELEPILVPVEQSMEEELTLIPKEIFRYISVEKEDFAQITKEVLVYEKISAPISKEEELGTIIYSLNGKEIGRIALVAEREIKEATYLDYLKKILSYF